MSRSVPGGVRHGILALAILAVAVAALPSVAAQGNQSGNVSDVVTFTVVGQEGNACEETFCFDVPVQALAPNVTVNITFTNPTGNTQHSFYIMPDGETTGGAQPDVSEALAGVDTLQAGESASTGRFQVPASQGSLYLWCNEPGHAQQGMWEFIGLGAAAAGGGGELVAQQVGVPLFSYWVGVIAIFAMFGWLAATFFVLRYQSSHHTDHRDREKD